MKVKIEFEVNTKTTLLLRCLYDRLDILLQDLKRMDSNFKDINLTVVTHSNQIYNGTHHINFHKPLSNEALLELVKCVTPDTKKAVEKILLNSLYGSTASASYGYLKCPMHHNGTCWGTKDKEKCTCEGFKSFCTHYPKGE